MFYTCVPSDTCAARLRARFTIMVRGSALHLQHVLDLFACRRSDSHTWVLSVGMQAAALSVTLAPQLLLSIYSQEEAIMPLRTQLCHC